MAITSDERGFWPPYIGELWDAAIGGSSENMSATNHGTQISRVEVRAMAKSGRRRGPIDVNELIVFMADVAAVGHSMGESTDGARSHRFLLNNRECVTVPYLVRQLSVFHKPD